MFGELPNLFGRNFVVGFFLPATTLAGALLVILSAFSLVETPNSLTELDALVGATIAIGVVWLLAVSLMALNRPILRLLEGYGDWHPLAWRKRCEKRRFSSKAKPSLDLQTAVDAARAAGQPDPNTPNDHATRLRNAVERYPDDEEWVLPTRFGNTFRAIEVYSRVVYGLDAIPAWGRLQAVMPDHFREQLAEAKAQLDFWVNLIITGGVSVALYGGLALWKSALPAIWLPFSAALLTCATYYFALSGLAQYGVYVKSAVDLYRDALAKHLGLELPRSAEAEREMWQLVSRVMIFRSAAGHDRLTKFRPLSERDI